MQHHEIVALEGIHQPLPASFDFGSHASYSLTSYDRTAAHELHSRVGNATILIVTVTKITAETLHPDVTPKLQLVAVMATGTDPVDLEACRERGIRVVNSPAANLDSVSEHAISLYFAARRRTCRMNALTREEPSQWKRHGSLNQHMRFADGTPPLTCGDEVMGIIGYGGLGKRIATLGRALGMHVLVAARKTPDGALPSSDHPAGHGDDRVPFDDVLRRSTVLVLSLPRNPHTLNLVSTAELAVMSPYAVLVNIARGGIVDESAVVHALQEGQIAGYATDVYQVEPVDGDTPLLSEEARSLNITMTPHLAWFSKRTMKNLGEILKNTVEAWVRGEELNVIA